MVVIRAGAFIQSSVHTDLQQGEEQGSEGSPEGMEKQQTPGAVLSWEQTSKQKNKTNQKLCWVENNNAGATISTRGRKSFLI